MVGQSRKYPLIARSAELSIGPVAEHRVCRRAYRRFRRRWRRSPTARSPTTRFRRRGAPPRFAPLRSTRRGLPSGGPPRRVVPGKGGQVKNEVLRMTAIFHSGDPPEIPVADANRYDDDVPRRSLPMQTAAATRVRCHRSGPAIATSDRLRPSDHKGQMVPFRPRPGRNWSDIKCSSSPVDDLAK